jgi:beta-lactamase class A
VRRVLAIATALVALTGGTAAAGGPALQSDTTRAQEWAEAFGAAERFARARDGRVSLALIDDTGRLRRHRSARRYPSASIVKAMLLVGYLNRIRDRRVGSSDRELLDRMILRSGNRAASSVLSVVGHAGLHQVARRAGMKRFSTTVGWSNTQVTAADQARLFARIDRLVPKRHRRYARSLLGGIIDRQRWGVPPALPPEARVFFKGGWRAAPDGWITHQAALVERGGSRVTIAVLTDRNPDREYGRRTIRGIAERALRPLTATMARSRSQISRK